ncbi:fructosamine-3-kinase [Phyllobacterium ifriqiyense]|uniref:Fructosamine-3-kinase n=1 Tax=Phyllobacterium ifriqiyense TaxID=314238 RepID=A0ABU0S451_9HYPH|nr:fructosamine-3-kinase [Phyllobacterium ifriqiyense]
MHVRLVLGSLVADMHKPIVVSENETIHAEGSDVDVTHQTQLPQQSGWPFKNRIAAVKQICPSGLP